MVRPYKVPLYPIIPMVATLGGVFIVISTLISQPKNAMLGIVITLIGLPVYSIMNKKKQEMLRKGKTA